MARNTLVEHLHPLFHDARIPAHGACFGLLRLTAVTDGLGGVRKEQKVLEVLPAHIPPGLGRLAVAILMPNPPYHTRRAP